MSETRTDRIEDGMLVSEIEGWYQVVTKDNDGEAHIHTLEKHSTKTRPLVDAEDILVTQAPPIRVTPSRAKSESRNFRRYASIPDEQIGYRNIGGELVPIHDERAMKLARFILKDAKPDVIVAQGDTIDMAELSRFSPDSDHFIKTLQPSIDRATTWNAELSADHPNAEKIRLEGNHQRLTKFILKNAMELHGIKRGNSETPLLSLDYLTRASELGWESISGYPANEWAEDGIVFVHGNKVRSTGSTAELMSRTYPERNVVFGHIHRQEMHTRTNYLGKYITAISFGTLARIDGAVPSYGNGVDNENQVVHKTENWQQGIGIVDRYDDDFVFQPIPISDGVAHWQGREYRADLPD